MADGEDRPGSVSNRCPDRRRRGRAAAPHRPCCCRSSIRTPPSTPCSSRSPSGRTSWRPRCRRMPHRGSARTAPTPSASTCTHAFDIGAFNPCFPEYEFDRIDAETASGRVSFPVVFEGPPGLVHGGFLAVFFDCVIQHQSCATGLSGKTRSLTVTFRRPTPHPHRAALRHRPRTGRTGMSRRRRGCCCDDEVLCIGEATTRRALAGQAHRRSTSASGGPDPMDVAAASGSRASPRSWHRGCATTSCPAASRRATCCRRRRACSTEFGVSPPALREAIHILETDGLISVRRGNMGGAVVHLPSAERTAHMISMVLQTRGSTPADVSEALMHLEPICAGHVRRRARIG